MLLVPFCWIIKYEKINIWISQYKNNTEDFYCLCQNLKYMVSVSLCHHAEIVMSLMTCIYIVFHYYASFTPIIMCHFTIWIFSRFKRHHPGVSLMIVLLAGYLVIYLFGSVIVFLFGIALPLLGMFKLSLYLRINDFSSIKTFEL